MPFRNPIKRLSQLVADSITGATITGGTITGAIIQTAAAGRRLVLQPIGGGGQLRFFSGAVAEALDAHLSGVYNAVTDRLSLSLTSGDLNPFNQAANVNLFSATSTGAPIGGDDAAGYPNRSTIELDAAHVVVTGRLEPEGDITSGGICDTGWIDMVSPAGWTSGAGGTCQYRLLLGHFLQIKWTGGVKNAAVAVSAIGGIADQIFDTSGHLGFTADGGNTFVVPNSTTCWVIAWGGSMAWCSVNPQGEVHIGLADGTGAARNIAAGQAPVGVSPLLYVE